MTTKIAGWTVPAPCPDTIRKQLENHACELQKKRAVRAFVRTRHVVLEIGAGIGVVTNEISLCAKHVDAYEPQEAVFECLRANLESRRSKATPHCAGIGLKAGYHVVEPNHEFWEVSVEQRSIEQSVGDGRVFCFAFGNVLRHRAYSVIVMDCEGAEHTLLTKQPLSCDVATVIVSVHPDKIHPNGAEDIDHAMFRQAFVRADWENEPDRCGNHIAIYQRAL